MVSDDSIIRMGIAAKILKLSRNSQFSKLFSHNTRNPKVIDPYMRVTRNTGVMNTNVQPNEQEAIFPNDKINTSWGMLTILVSMPSLSHLPLCRYRYECFKYLLINLSTISHNFSRSQKPSNLPNFYKLRIVHVCCIIPLHSENCLQTDCGVKHFEIKNYILKREKVKNCELLYLLTFFIFSGEDRPK